MDTPPLWSPIQPGTLRQRLQPAGLVIVALVAVVAGMLLAEFRLASAERALVRRSRNAGRSLADSLTHELTRRPGQTLRSAAGQSTFQKAAASLLRTGPAIAFLRAVDDDGNVVWTSEGDGAADRWIGGRPDDFLAGGVERTRVPDVEQDDGDLFLEMVASVGGQPATGTLVLGLSEAGMAAEGRRDLWRTIGVLAGFGTLLFVALILAYGQLLQRRGEQLLRRAHAEHLGELGMLAAGLAHELRNPLNAMRFAAGSLELRAEHVQPPQLATEMVGITGEISEEITALDRILTSFLAYARPAREEAEEVDVVAVCRAALGVVERSSSASGVVLELAVPPEPVLARLVAGRLRQVLINLLLNAVDASPAAGRVRMSVARTGETLLLAVDDDGPGVPASLAASLFEPFTTTKPGGSGLGLAICRRLVSEMQGEIRYRPGAAGGSRFEVSLPVAPAG